MSDKYYQKLHSADQGPLSIDRVTLDGPRDVVGDFAKLRKDGPAFDLSAEAGELSAQKLDNKEGVQAHLEENYDYAKRIERAIQDARKSVAQDVVSMQDRLAIVQS